MTPSQLKANLHADTEKWIAEHDSKLRQYAKALKAKDNSDFWEEGDFYQKMVMKVWYAMTQCLFDKPEAYILKTVWNEGLMMIRQQRRYEQHLVLKNLDEDPERGDPIENIPGAVTENPELRKVEADFNDVLAAAIATLPIKSRQVCAMLYAGEKPVEVARRMGLKSRSAVTWHLNRIRETFLQFGLRTS